jgi:transcriptional regulator with XRE-family HTH domain
MAPRTDRNPPPKAIALAQRLAMELGQQVRDERTRRRWTIAQLAERSGLSLGAVHRVEAGAASTLGGYARLGVALGLDARFALTHERAAAAMRDADVVHAAMGEVEARHLRRHGHEVLLDEPYQHYQFAGRADLVAVDRSRRALLHLENRTRFPDVQAFAGSFNAKRAYLAPELAERLGIHGGFLSETHVVVALWSAEVVRTLRLRAATFRSTCPDALDPFAAWWSGEPVPAGRSSSLVLFDPVPGQRASRRRWVGLDDGGKVEARYRGYADALAALRRVGAA